MLIRYSSAKKRSCSAVMLCAAFAMTSSGCAATDPPATNYDAIVKLPLIERGEASFYSDALAGRPTATGEPYDPTAATCAHPTLAFQTTVAVVDPATKRFATCRVNDRGPYAKDRVLDVSRAVATSLKFVERGHLDVELRLVSAPEAEKAPGDIAPKAPEKKAVAAPAPTEDSPAPKAN